MKYPPLQEPCRSCLGCMRLENPNFIADKNCRYRDRKIESKNIEGVQEKIKM